MFSSLINYTICGFNITYVEKIFRSWIYCLFRGILKSSIYYFLCTITTIRKYFITFLLWQILATADNPYSNPLFSYSILQNTIWGSYIWFNTKICKVNVTDFGLLLGVGRGHPQISYIRNHYTIVKILPNPPQYGLLLYEPLHLSSCRC